MNGLLAVIVLFLAVYVTSAAPSSKKSVEQSRTVAPLKKSLGNTSPTSVPTISRKPKNSKVKKSTKHARSATPPKKSAHRAKVRAAEPTQQSPYQSNGAPFFQRYQASEGPSSYQSSEVPSSSQSSEFPSSYQSSEVPSSYQSSEVPSSYQSSEAPPSYQTSIAPSLLQSSYQASSPPSIQPSSYQASTPLPLQPSSYQASAGLPIQQYHTQSYHTHSLYPTYNIHHQHPFSSYSSFVPQAGLSLPSFENIKKENDALKLGSTVDAKSVGLIQPQGSFHALNPFIAITKTASGDCVKGTVHSHAAAHNGVDPIFGPEIGEKYEIHYNHEHLSSLPLPSAYSSFPAHPIFPPAYSGLSGLSSFPSLPAYSGFPPVFGGINSFPAGGGVPSPALPPSNGNKEDVLPVSPSTPVPEIGSSYPGSEVSSSSESPSSEFPNEISSESDIGAPASIDGVDARFLSSTPSYISSEPTTRKK